MRAISANADQDLVEEMHGLLRLVCKDVDSPVSVGPDMFRGDLDTALRSDLQKVGTSQSY